MWKRAIAVALLGACAPDAANQILLQPDTPATFVAVADGFDGTWAAVAARDDGSYWLDVTDDYRVVVACANQPGASERFSTFAEDQFGLTACPRRASDGGTPPPLLVTVRVTMQQPGLIDAFGTEQSSTTAPWTFTAQAPPGTYDLVAHSDPELTDLPRIAIRRDLAVTAPTELPAIDLDAEGATLAAVPLFVTGADPALSSAQLTLETANGQLATLSSSGDPAVYAAPASLLVAGDHQSITLLALDSPLVDQRIDARYVTGGSTSLAFLAAPDVTFHAAPTFVTWTALPPETSGATLSISAPRHTASDDPILDVVTASPGWLALHVGEALAFDASMSGFDPAWQVPESGAQIEFSITRNDPGAVARTTVAAGPAVP